MKNFLSLFVNLNARQSTTRTLLLICRVSAILLMFLFLGQQKIIAQTTLCSQLGGQYYPPGLAVGIGSPYGITKSSQLYSNSLNGVNIHVVGDFTVDADFTLNQCNIKVDPTYRIVTTTTGYTNVNFTVGNCKFFSCGGMWQGLDIGSFTTFVMHDSKIEDATFAVNSYNAGYTTLNLTYNNFNRNTQGVNIATPEGILSTQKIFIQ